MRRHVTVKLYSSPLRRIRDAQVREVILSVPSDAVQVAFYIALAYPPDFIEYLKKLNTSFWVGNIYARVPRGFVEYVNFLTSVFDELGKYKKKELFTAMILFAVNKSARAYRNLLIARTRYRSQSQ